MGMHFTLGVESQWYSIRNSVAAILFRTVATVFATLLELTQKMVGIVLFWQQKSSKSKLNLPPGPKAYPVIGSLPSLGRNPHQTVAEMTQKYGPVVFLKLGSQPTVVTHDPDVVNLIMHDHVFTSRPQTVCGHFLTYGSRDVVTTPPDDRWRALRKICVMELLSNKRVEGFAGLRQKEVAELVTSVVAVGESGRLEVEIRGMVERYNMNILTGMILGKKYFGTHYDAAHAAHAGGHNVDDNNSEVARLLMDGFRYFGVFNISDFIPWLAPLDLQGHLRNVKKIHAKLDAKIQAIIDEHRAARTMTAGSRAPESRKKDMDFVDVLQELPGLDGEKHIDDVTIKAVILILMWSGLDVPVSVCEWAMAELVKNPEMQLKLQKELDSVVGTGSEGGGPRLVRDSDLPNLPYLKCVLKEVFRLHPPGAFGVPRLSLAASKLKGYDIPAGTLMLVGVGEFGMSSKFWEDPHVFRPERWEGSNLSHLTDPEHKRIFPFGAGRRACAGTNLGTSLVFLVVANLVHHFAWAPPRGMRPDDIDMSVSIADVSPPLTPLRAIATPRRCSI